VDRALALEADVYVIQEAEPVERYAGLLPAGTSVLYVIRPGDLKGVLVFTRPGYLLSATAGEAQPAYAHVVPLTVSTPVGESIDLWAVWTLASSPREAAYVGQAHLALNSLEGTLKTDTVMIGDYNSNSIWDHERRRNHGLLVDRLAERGLVSAYHRWTGESQGEESTPTFFLHRNAAKPFHLDHCFTDLEVIDVQIGTFAEWSGLKASGGASDHVPLVVTVVLR
jgi:hypothetical protein